jgi:hypothetical protein
VKSRYEERLREGAARYLEPGEELLAVLICQPRGRRARADEAGLLVSASMAMVVTRRRLLTLKISRPAIGRGGELRQLLGAVPLSDVDSVEVKRFGLGKRITVVVRGVPVLLDSTLGTSAFAEAFNCAKAAA